MWGLESRVPFAKAHGADPRSEVRFAIRSVASAGLDFPHASSPKGTPPGPRLSDSIYQRSDPSQHVTLVDGKERDLRVLRQGLGNAVPPLALPKALEVGGVRPFTGYRE